MAATTEQKVDFLLKKVGYSLSKTGSVTGTGSISGGTTKEPFAESIPSPLVIPDDSIWNQSLSIPGTPPGSTTAIVQVYPSSGALRLTADSSVSGSRAFIAYTTYNNTSTPILGDWIDTQFGTGYVLKVYKGDPNSGGTLLPAGGTGSNDIWFFDYSSGILNFNGTALPSGVNDTNIYIVGYRYVGSKGVSSPGAINPTNLYVSGITTTAGLLDINGGGQANTFKIEDLTAGRVVLAGTGGEIEDNSKLTFNGHELNVTGHVETDTVNVSGLSTFAGAVDINDGGTANTFKVEDLTAGRVVLAGTGGEVEDSANLKFTGSDLIVGTGVTANNTGVIVSGVTTSIGLVAGSAKVEDLTSGRVVLAGTGGELGDDADLTFTGSDLVIGTGVTANNTGVIVSGVTTSISFVGPLTGNSTTATDLSINATQRLLLQTGNNATDVLGAGNAGQVLQSAGSGSAPTWVNAASSGAIEGITVQEEGSTVGTANSISTLNFVGSAVFADAAALAGIATITVTAEDPVAMAIALG